MGEVPLYRGYSTIRTHTYDSMASLWPVCVLMIEYRGYSTI